MKAITALLSLDEHDKVFGAAGHDLIQPPMVVGDIIAALPRPHYQEDQNDCEERAGRSDAD
jgi:hypothetical protein